MKILFTIRESIPDRKLLLYAKISIIFCLLLTGLFMACGEKTETNPETETDSITYEGNPVYYENGNVEFGELAKNTTINGRTYAAGTSLFFYENGNVESGTLAKNTTIDGITYVKGSIQFYENGQILSRILSENTTIDGITYAADTVLFFYNNGNVNIVILAEDTTIDGVIYEGGSRIYFDYDEDGNVTSVIEI